MFIVAGEISGPRLLMTALMVFKALNDLAPDYLSPMFTERNTSGYVVRDCTNKLRADVSKYRPEVYKSEKSKILKKFHRVALGKLLT